MTRIYQAQHVQAPHFIYKSLNPYNERMEDYSLFVYKDNTPETFCGKWCDDVFRRKGPLHVELGMGFGHFMQRYCGQNPEVNFVGIDYRFKRTFQLAARISKALKEVQGSSFCHHFRILRARAERINYLFGPCEIDRLYCFYSDPWPKGRHHKKRLFQQDFLQHAFHSLKEGAEFWIKTDHLEYFEWIKKLGEKSPFKIILQSTDLFSEFPTHSLCSNLYETKFEKIFKKQNIPIKGIIFKRAS